MTTTSAVRERVRDGTTPRKEKTMMSIIALIVFAMGCVVYFASEKARELGRAMMWVGLFFLVAELAPWHAVPVR